MKKHFIYALAMGAFIAISSTTLHAQGLFAKAGQQAEKAVAVFESTWDDFYGKLDELLIAEVDKENGDLAFDSERGIASFTVFLKVNEDAYAKWEQNSWTLLEACGIKEDASSSWQFGRKRFAINDNTAAEINRVAAAGELTPPITGGGVVVKLVDKNGTMLQYAAFPFGLFRNGKEHSGWEIPAFLMHEMNGVYFYDNSRDGFNRKDGGSMKPASLFVTFAGVTRKSLLSVEDIRCEVLVAPKFQEECLRLSKEKIESDSKTFEEHGIESKVIMLSGKVPLAVNKTPRGTWFSRYEVTEAQWGAVMGEDNPSIINPSRIGQLDGRDKQAPETAHDVAKFFGTASFMCIASPDMPVDYISWFKAKEFIGKLNALPEVKESGLVFDIPNGFYFHGNYHHEPDSHWNKGDPHWEYACLGAKAFGALEMERQGVDFGLDLDGNKMELQEVGWCRELHDLIEDQKRGVWRSDMAHPVGMKRPNAFGLYDMIGNVSELVSTSSSSKEWVAKCPFGLNHSDGYRDNESGYIESDKGKALRGLRLFARPKAGGGTSSRSSTSSDATIPDTMGDSPELMQALTEAGIKSSPLKDVGGYSTTFELDEGRKQTVYIFSDVDSVANINVRAVSSFIARSANRPVTAAQMGTLLAKSGGDSLGHLCLSKPASFQDPWLLYYSSKVSATAPASELEATVRECASVADRWEKELFSKDDN